MRKIGIALSAAILSAALILATGCGTGTPPPKKTPPKVGNGKQGDTKTEVASMGFGKLTGMVVYDGDPPPLKLNEDMKKHNDAATCHAGDATEVEKAEQEWVVEPKTKGVANVVVYLKADENEYFKIHDDDKKRKDEVVLDQPHCAYVPHTFVAFPGYYDAESGEVTKSGQKLIIANSAKVVHDTNFTGDSFAGNEPQKHQLPPGQKKEVTINPQSKPINFTCNVHKFMRAYAFALDHPYAAVSKGFPELKGGKAVPVPAEQWGKFEIARVPAGVPVRVVVWHEKAGYVDNGDFKGEEGKMITFEDGKAQDLKIKIKK